MTHNTDYTVGYGRPPVATRFQKGKSGNPSGRPKRQDLPALEAFLSCLKDDIVVRSGGKRKKVRIYDAIVRRLVDLALQGDRQIGLALLTLGHQHGLTKAKATCPVKDEKFFRSLSDELREAVIQIAERLTRKDH